MANITNQEMMSSKAKQTADRELMRLKRDHQGVLSEWQLELQVVREKNRSALESYEITNLAMENICDPMVKASAEDQAVAKAMVHIELMQKEGLEGTMDMKAVEQDRRHGAKQIKIPETSGIDVLYPHVGVCACRSVRKFFLGASCLRSYSTPFKCDDCKCKIQRSDFSPFDRCCRLSGVI